MYRFSERFTKRGWKLIQEEGRPESFPMPGVGLKGHGGVAGTTQKILISSGKLFVYQGLVIIFGFVLQALIAHVCGPEGVGGFTLMVSWLGIIAVLTVPGLEGTLVYYLPRLEGNPEARRKVVRFCLGIVVGVSVLIAALVMSNVGGMVRRIGLPEFARVPLGLAIMLFSLGKLQDAVFLGMKQTPIIGYYNFVRTLLRLLFILPVIWFPAWSWRVLFSAVALEAAATLILKYRRIRREYPELSHPGESSQPPTSAILTIALPMFGIGIIDTLFPFMDKAMLGAILPLAMLGTYRVAESVASLNTVFVSPFMVFWPYISQLFQEDRLDELRAAYRTITLLILILMVPSMLVMLECSSLVLGFFGASFARNGNLVFQILAMGCFADALAGPAGAVLKMTRHPRLSLAINLGLLLLYLVLSYIWTLRFGLLGAAAAKTVVMIVGNLSNVIANRLLLNIFPFTWKHGLLLLIGVLIAVLRNLLPDAGPGLLAPIIWAGGQAMLFCATALLILRSELGPIRLRIQEMAGRRPGR